MVTVMDIIIIIATLGLLRGFLGLLGVPVGICTGMIIGAEVAAYKDNK